MKCPCKDCQKHSADCHANCTDGYKEWRAALDEVNKKKNAWNQVKGISRDHELKYRKNLKEGRKHR
jgi:hypothetical protein